MMLKMIMVVKRDFGFFFFFSFCFVSSTFGPVITALSGTGQQNNEIYFSSLH